MIIITAGNHRFFDVINHSVSQCKKLGYQIEVYDLLNLGFGKAWTVTNSSFQKNGFYHRMASCGWCSKGLHKPEIIEDALNNHKTFVVYLDGDAVIASNIDEVVGDFDVGVTIRSPAEMQAHMAQANSLKEPEKTNKKACQANAGVLFFQYTDKTLAFVKRWKEKTRELGNDQLAINKLVNPNNIKLVACADYTVDDVKVRIFPGKIYNFTNIQPRQYDNRYWWQSQISEGHCTFDEAVCKIRLSN